MEVALYAVYAVVFIFASIWAIRLALRSKSLGTWLLASVALAMIFEDGVLAIGALIGHGPLLEALSWLRFIGLVVFPPLLIVTGLEMNRRAGIAWGANRNVRLVTWVGVVALIAFGLYQLSTITLAPKVLNDVVRYVASPKLPPPIPIIMMSVGLIGLGFTLWRHTGSILLLASAAFVFVGDALAASRYVIGSGVELVFMLLLIVTEAQLIQQLSRRPVVEAEQQPAFKH